MVYIESYRRPSRQSRSGRRVSGLRYQQQNRTPSIAARTHVAILYTIDRVVVPKTNLLKIVGVTIDRTLKFQPHCKLAKKACAPRLRVLKMIGSKLPRGSRSTLLQVGSAIVTSKLLYGIGLVSRGGQAAIQTLAPAYNRMIRFASGAFVTSTINSTMIEAGTLPFELLAANPPHGSPYACFQRIAQTSRYLNDRQTVSRN